MRFEDERYVRVYTRSDPEWTLLPWQSRVTWDQLLKLFDRAGILALGKSRWKGVASAARIPLEIVEAGMPDLLLDGCCELLPDGKGGEVLFSRNFMAAQEAKQNEGARSRAYREKLTAKKGAAAIGITFDDVTPRDDTDGGQSGQDGDDEPPIVTPRNAAVTPRDGTDGRRTKPSPCAVPSVPSVLSQTRTTAHSAGVYEGDLNVRSLVAPTPKPEDPDTRTILAALESERGICEAAAKSPMGQGAALLRLAATLAGLVMGGKPIADVLAAVADVGPQLAAQDPRKWDAAVAMVVKWAKNQHGGKHTRAPTVQGGTRDEARTREVQAVTAAIRRAKFSPDSEV